LTVRVVLSGTAVTSPVGDRIIGRHDVITAQMGWTNHFVTGERKSDLAVRYLEPHHIRRLTDGGPDDPQYVIALCPNCHREVHSGVEGEKKNRDFQSVVADKEGN
tara:strand:- start:606 stop:920 length:315 start_codon:yes stop_codon:yes gene_type:complete